MKARLALAAALAAAAPAAAADFSFNGYGDVRLVAPPSTGSYLDGDLGKLRYRNGDEVFQPGDIVG